jgi:phage-related protein
MVEKVRELFFYKDYFKLFYGQQAVKVQKKILWTLRLVEELEKIPETYFKHIECSDGLYEIRVQMGSNIFRIFCFFDDNNIVVVGNGFQKKSQKTPPDEIQRANRIKKEYYEEKQKSDQPQSIY